MKLQDLVEERNIIEGDVDLPSETTKLDYEGATIMGRFNCFSTRITSLKGSPRRVEGTFNCGDTRITSLEGAPIHVGDGFGCRVTKIKTLKGSPRYVGSGFYCDKTPLVSLEGAPSYIGGSLNCSGTKLTSLHNVHKHVKHIGISLTFSSTVKSNVLGVMLIKGLKNIEILGGDNKQTHVERIINKHLKGDRDVHACQEEMLEAGLGDYAKL